MMVFVHLLIVLLLNENIESVESKGSAITVTPAIETIMVTQDGSINRILNRNECLMAKAPQSFRLDDILSVHDRAKDDGIHDFIDSASMMMHYGYTLYPVLGETENIKNYNTIRLLYVYGYY